MGLATSGSFDRNFDVHHRQRPKECQVQDGWFHTFPTVSSSRHVRVPRISAFSFERTNRTLRSISDRNDLLLTFSASLGTIQTIPCCRGATLATGCRQPFFPSLVAEGSMPTMVFPLHVIRTQPQPILGQVDESRVQTASKIWWKMGTALDSHRPSHPTWDPPHVHGLVQPKRMFGRTKRTNPSMSNVRKRERNKYKHGVPLALCPRASMHSLLRNSRSSWDHCCVVSRNNAHLEFFFPRSVDNPLITSARAKQQVNHVVSYVPSFRTVTRRPIMHLWLSKAVKLSYNHPCNRNNPCSPKFNQV